MKEAWKRPNNEGLGQQESPHSDRELRGDESGRGGKRGKKE